MYGVASQGPVFPAVSPLVGRGAELEALSGLVRGLAAGRGAAALVIGEPGVGKSALVSAAAEEAVRAGAVVFWGVADELGSAFPLLPFIDALGIRTAPDERRAAIARLLREVSATPGADPVNAASEQLLALVDDLCADAPTVLCIDDLHWADAASVRLWHQLARSLEQLPLLLLATARAVPVRADIKTLRRQLRSSGAPVIELEALSAASVAELVAALAGGRPGSQLLDLAGQAGGNPLYVAELVAALARGDRLVRPNGVVEVTGVGVPASLTEAIEDRLTGLQEETLQMLRAAALLGVEFRLAELALATSLPIAHLGRLLSDAAGAGVLADAALGMRFRHPLIRQALYEQIAPSFRRALHRDLARSLANSEASVVRVTQHLLAAVSPDEDEASAELLIQGWAVDWLVQHGDVAVNRAPEPVAGLLRQCLAAVPAEDPRRARLAVRLTEALYRMGQPAASARVAKQALAVTPADVGLDARVELVVAYAQARFTVDQAPQIIAFLEQELAQPRLRPEHRVNLQIQLSRNRFVLGQVQEAGRLAEEALSVAREIGDRGAAGWALSQLAFQGTQRYGDAEAALPLYDEALRLLEGDAALTDVWLRAKINRTEALMILRRHAECERELKEAQRTAERFGNVRLLAQTHFFTCTLYFETGRWDEAVAEAEALYDAREYFPEVAPASVAAIIAIHRDDPAAIQRWLAATEQLARMAGTDIGDFGTIAQALAVERDGDTRAALAALAAAANTPSKYYDAAYRHDLASATTRTAMSVGDREAAVKATEQIEILASDPDSSHGMAIRYCRGTLDRDPEILGPLAEDHRRAGYRLLLAQALESLAEAWAERSRLDPARAALVEALETYQSLGAVWDLNRVRARFRRYGLRTGTQQVARRADHGWESLSPTETRIAAFVAQGLSNPQIGERLFLSRRTVQTHVSHILTKLDVRSRVEITRLVVEHQPQS